MSDQPSWRRLPVSHHDVPALLVSTSFTPTPASYVIQVTDLGNIWSESLDRRGILRRSLDEETTIDPSEDLDNMRAFLDKLRSAFETDHPEHSLTSLSLSVADNTTGDLILHITCILPRPLKPLKWSIHLKKCSPSVVASELVIPLIGSQYAMGHEIDALLDIVREKDAIITRLMDKFEAMGSGAESIWTHLAGPGKKKITRPAAQAKVKGLAPFDEAVFKQQLAKEDTGRSGGFPGVMDSVFGGAGMKQGINLDTDDVPRLKDWWTTLGSGSVTLTERKKESSKKDSTTPPPHSKLDGEDDGEFQVQATPPHLLSTRKRASASRPTIEEDGETTDDEEPSQIPDSNPPEPQRSATPPKKASRFGTIGKAKKPAPPPKSPTPPPPPVTRSQAGDDGSDTASDTASEAGDAAEPSPPPPSPPKPASSQPRKGGIGRIGGKPKTPAPELKAPTPPPAEESVHTTPKQAQGKLGRIGKKPAGADNPTVAPDDHGDSRGRSRTPATEKMDVEDEKPRETSEDRADRKRRELQRELERKAAAGPAKKKRKF